MKRQWKPFITISAWVILFGAIFVGSLYRPHDPDLGWHLKYGQYFFENSAILKKNIFSSEMRDYFWVNSSWGIDLITYQIFSIGGFLALSIASAAVVTLTFLILTKAFKISLWAASLLFPLLVFALSPVNEISFRGQQLSLLFLVILMYILSRYHDGYKKVILFLPLLFALWSNIHGQFILGLCVTILWYIMYAVSSIVIDKTKPYTFLSDTKYFLLSICTSIVTAMINPFGISVYNESLKHASNPLQKAIIEWSAFQLESYDWWIQIVTILGMTLGVGILLLQRKISRPFPFLVVGLVVFVASFFVRRYAWPGYYLIVPFFIPLAMFFKPRAKKDLSIVSCICAIIFLSYNLIVTPISSLYSMNWKVYCSVYLQCSDTSITVLTPKVPTLTMYDWGGYMIWKYPSFQPSIDGRMHLWRDKNGYSAFEQYYHYEQNLSDINTSPYDQVLISRHIPLYQRLNELSSEGKWDRVYEDKYAAVFVRMKNP